ncbi:MAG: hypothetical protein ACRES8_04310, partial [Nevskiaceae bacterium]
MKALNLFTWAALLLAAAPALAGREPFVNYWFTERGQPEPAAQRWAEAMGLPPLLSGAPFRDDLAAIGPTTPSCLTIQFLVRPDGLTDKFMILDSRPKG